MTVGEAAEAFGGKVAVAPEMDQRFVGKDIAVHDEDLLLVRSDERAASEQPVEVGGFHSGADVLFAEL